MVRVSVLGKLCFLILVIPPTILQFYDFLYVTHNFSSFEVLSLFYVLTFGLLFPFIFKDYIEVNYGLLSEIHMFSTYQYQRILLCVWCISLVYLIIVCSHLLGFFDKGLLCSVFFFIPVLSLLLGGNVFNDSSCIVDEEIVLGYPTVYPIISLILGIFGFSFILNSQVNSVIVLVITFVFQLVLVLPHVFNNFVPFEIRTKKGCLYFLVSCIFSYAVLIFLVIGGAMFNSADILNPARLLKNILIYGAGMVLVILFYRQFKKMNEKKK